MDELTLDYLHRWFTRYVATFKSGDEEYDRSIILKEDHTQRVCQEAQYIATEIELSQQDRRIAEVTALFHDIGRFEQYARFETFADHKSVDHAEFGVQILQKEGILKDIDPPDQDLILKVISCHNKKELPANETDRCILFSKLLRDADKLDIWRVFVDYYSQSNGHQIDTVIHGLPNTPGVSDAICKDLLAEKSANYAHARNLNDFKLLQISWIYDINYHPTFRQIQSRDYLKTYQKYLPQTEQVHQIISTAQSYLQARIEA